MMLIHSCARGVRGHAPPHFFFDKNGAIWCILSVPKLVIINLKINIFLDNQLPKFCATYFSEINPDAHFGTKINTYTFYKGGLPKKKRNGGFTFFYIKYYIPDAKIYPVMVWIQILARGPVFFFIKMVQSCAF